MAFILILLSVAATLWWLLAADADRTDPMVDSPLPGGHPAGTGRVPPPISSDPLDAERCLIETQLVAGRLSGTLSPADYHGAMAVLAAVDAFRKPVSIPPEHIA